VGRRAEVLALTVLALGLAACGSSGSPASSQRVASGRAGQAAAFSLSRLASLENYRFTSSSSTEGHTLRITGLVHGPEDWEIESTVPVPERTYDVGGRGYAVVFGHVEPVRFETPEGYSHLDGERTFATALIGYTHVTGIRITRNGSCQVAGTAGTLYHVATPSNAASLLLETATACVADRSGALLSYRAGVPSGSAAAHIRGVTSSFTVVAIGGVGEINPPKAAPTTTLPTVPTTTTPAGGSALPAGFPSTVPQPPGSILTGVRISSTKWYLLLTERSDAALRDYTAVLTAKGFTVTSSSGTAAGDLEQLAKGGLHLLLEQIGLPGQGVTLAVTVDSSP
jgi:hypothetical protein